MPNTGAAKARPHGVANPTISSPHPLTPQRYAARVGTRD